MNKLFKLIFIILILIGLYLIRGEIFLIYQNIQEGFKNDTPLNIKNIFNLKKDTDESAEKLADQSLAIGFKKIVQTPGALRVANFANSFNHEIKLTPTGIVAWTNKNRQIEGDLEPLTVNQRLNLSAERKVKDMLARQYFEHISPTGQGVGNLADEVDYQYIIIGENLALGNFKDDQAVVAAWMASPGHRANILNKKYTEIGVYAAKGTFEGKETWLAVQHFGLSRDKCPELDEKLKLTIEIAQKSAKTISKELTTKLADINNRVVPEGSTEQAEIKKYNDIVTNYNKLIAEIKKNVDKYNATVRAFNLCIESVK